MIWDLVASWLSPTEPPRAVLPCITLTTPVGRKQRVNRSGGVSPHPQCRFDPPLPQWRLPGSQRLVGEEVVLRDRVGAYYDLHIIFLFDELRELIDIGAGWVAHDEASCQMDHLSPVLFHLGRGVFDVSTRTSSATGVPYQLYLFLLVEAESALAVSEGSQAFSTRARTIALADYYPDPLQGLSSFCYEGWSSRSGLN